MSSLQESSVELRITLELVSEGVSELDLSVISAIGRDFVSSLQHEGYLVGPSDTSSKTRGGELLVDIIQNLSNVATNAWIHREMFENLLSDASSLITICGGVTAVLQHMVETYKKRAIPGNDPLKITLEIEGKTVSVEASDVEQADAALKLARKYAIDYPDATRKITSQSKTKIKGTLPKQHSRKGR